VPFGLDLPYWVEDEQFDFDHHIHRVAVPSPGDDRALAETAAYLYSRHLDRSRPLWEAWFIEGLADGRYAMLQKMHHCMMDGEGAARLSAALLDFEPGAGPAQVDPAIAGARPGEVPEWWRESVTAALRLNSLPVRFGWEAYAALRHSLWQRLTGRARPGQKAAAPLTSFNADIGSDRGFVFGSLPLADIKKVRKHYDATVNDVLLALVGASLRNYLLQRDELPERSLRSSIAVSLRTADDDDFSNRITTAAVTLATDLDDPGERLRVITRDAREAKERAHHNRGKGLLEIVGMLPPLAVGAVINLAPPDQIIKAVGVNVIVSSIRGSDRPAYIGGARIDAMYPISIISPGGGINVTCISYTGNVDFGITIDPDLVPEPWTLIDGLHGALADYLKLVSPARRRKKSARAGPRRGKQTRR
jgi:WS/DGAT/MGAT family acyltransferase